MQTSSISFPRKLQICTLTTQNKPHYTVLGCTRNPVDYYYKNESSVLKAGKVVSKLYKVEKSRCWNCDNENKSKVVRSAKRSFYIVANCTMSRIIPAPNDNQRIRLVKMIARKHPLKILEIPMKSGVPMNIWQLVSRLLEVTVLSTK